MQFLILGPLEVSDDGRKLALGGPKQRAVLAPQAVDQQIRRNDVVRAQDQVREHGPLLGPAEGELAPVVGDLERPRIRNCIAANRTTSHWRTEARRRSW